MAILFEPGQWLSHLNETVASFFLNSAHHIPFSQQPIKQSTKCLTRERYVWQYLSCMKRLVIGKAINLKCQRYRTVQLSPPKRPTISVSDNNQSILGLSMAVCAWTQYEFVNIVGRRWVLTFPDHVPRAPTRHYTALTKILDRTKYGIGSQSAANLRATNEYCGLHRFAFMRSLQKPWFQSSSNTTISSWHFACLSLHPQTSFPKFFNYFIKAIFHSVSVN